MKRMFVLALCLSMLFQTEMNGAGNVLVRESPETNVLNETELVELRTANSETYVLSDGTYQTVLYSEDKYYANQRGELTEIDDSIVPTSFSKDGTDYCYTNAEDNNKVYFSGDGSISIFISANNADLSFSLQNAQNPVVISTTDSERESIAGYALGGPNCIEYREDEAGIEAFYAVYHDAIKEYLVLNDASAARQFSFSVRFSGCKIYTDSEGNIGFIDPFTGEEKYRIGQLFAVDSNGIRCDDFSFSISDSNENIVTLSFSVPDSYLDDANRLYPVMVDPTVLISGSSSTYDTCIDQQYPTSNYYLSTNLWTGGQIGNNAMRTLIKFNLPNNVSGSQITRATLRIQKREYQAPTIRAHRITSAWSSSTTTWNNQPGYALANISPTCTADGGDWYKMDVTSIVYGWLNGTNNNFGFLLKEISESSSSQKTKFYSSDSDYPHRPELVINYVNYLGARGINLTEREDINGMGYALEHKSFVFESELIPDLTVLNGKSKQEVLDYLAAKAGVWMNTHLGTGNYASISSYDADISTASPGWYRVVLRIGITGAFSGSFGAGNSVIMQWRYMTNEGYGVWAEKVSMHPGGSVSGSNGLNPATEAWNVEGYTVDSAGKYYSIKHCRSIDWTGTGGN